MRHRRQAPHLWCLLVLDSLNQHTLNPKALQILNSANILAISLPSHTSHILQVHDLSIFGPLKKYLRSNVSQYVRENGPEVKLQHLPVILEEPWVLVNNPLNIKKGFEKAGLWPLNLNWVEENLTKIAFHKKKDKEDQLEDLIQFRLFSGEVKSIIKGLIYLDLARNFESSSAQLNREPPRLERSLSTILLETRNKIQSSIKIKIAPKKNMISEFFEDAKILNEQERIERLAEAIEARNKKKKAKFSSQASKETKKRKCDKISQSQGPEIQEITYDKKRLK